MNRIKWFSPMLMAFALLFGICGTASADAPSMFMPMTGMHCKDETISATPASVSLPTGLSSFQVYVAPTVSGYFQFSKYGSTAVQGTGWMVPVNGVVVMTAPVGYASLDFVSASSGTVNICVGQGG